MAGSCCVSPAKDRMAGDVCFNKSVSALKEDRVVLEVPQEVKQTNDPKVKE